MKTIRYIVLSILTLLFVAAPSAEAILYLTGDANFGPDSITVDTSTGLGWLNVSKAAGLSYQQVLSQTQSGGMFSGFRFATVPEVVQLYAAAGLTVSPYGNTALYYPVSSPAIQTFFSLLGTTGTINGLPGIVAQSGTGGLNAHQAPTLYGWDYAQLYWVSDGSGGASYGETYSSPDISSWLVKTVPEPMAANFFVLAAAAWCGYRRLPRRETSV